VRDLTLDLSYPRRVRPHNDGRPNVLWQFDIDTKQPPGSPAIEQRAVDPSNLAINFRATTQRLVPLTH
jgi:hypothetical protein